MFPSMIFLEALRQFAYKMGKEHFCHVHVRSASYLDHQPPLQCFIFILLFVSLVPVVGAVGEPKTKVFLSFLVNSLFR